MAVRVLVLYCCAHFVSCVPYVPQDVCTARARSNSYEVPFRHVYGTLVITVDCVVPVFDIVKPAEYCYDVMDCAQAPLFAPVKTCIL